MPSDGPVDAPDGDLPFLPDPYQPHGGGHAEAGAPVPPRPPRATVSGLALSALFSALLLGPVGAIAAVLFGWYARRDIEASGGRRKGYALATASLALGLILTPAWGALLSYLAWTRALRVDPAGETAGAAEQPEAPANGPGSHPLPGVAPLPSPPAPAVPVAPAHTTVTREGRITVVELGRDTRSLSDELARQRAQAVQSHETLVLMTTTSRCEPCRGVDRSLSDPLMQTALAGVRLVRVDTETFDEDLEGLHVPHDAVPGFFLLAPDLTPRDGIDGGEWGDDIAPNIAPVLGAFVRGKYQVRRTPWRPVPPSGMSL